MNLRIVIANLFVKLMSVYREKTTMFFTLAFPIILILVFGTIFMSQDNVNYHLYVQDLTSQIRPPKPSKPLGKMGSSS